MQWSDSPNAGFTVGTPWIKVNPNYKEINVADQEGREGSVLEFYKEMIRLRKDPEYGNTVVYGEMIPAYEGEKRLFAFYRKDEDHTLLVASNYQNEERTIPMEFDSKKILVNNYPEDNIEKRVLKVKDGWLLTLRPYQFIVAEL